MRTRNRPLTILPLFLSALLAWPTCVPITPVDLDRAGRPETVLKSGTPGPQWQNRDRRALLDRESWSDLADNIEASDGRDEFTGGQLGLDLPPADLPSLIPSALQSSPQGPIDRSADRRFSFPLRC